MKEHGILFSAPMVKALLARRKTVTRRMSDRWMRVKAGDVLWVRETFCICQGPAYGSGQSDPVVVYAADGKDGALKYKPSIHMPRWASRITLIATEDARREPLQDITEADAIAEGAEPIECPFCQEMEGAEGEPCYCGEEYSRGYGQLWDSLHGKDAPWASNPSVVRLAFKIAQIPDFDPAAPKGAKSID